MQRIRASVEVVAKVIHDLRLTNKQVTLLDSGDLAIMAINRMDAKPTLYEGDAHRNRAHACRELFRQGVQAVLQHAGVNTERELFLYSEGSTLSNDSKARYMQGQPPTYGDLLRNDPLSLILACALI
jgi:hypothetical protein